MKGDFGGGKAMGWRGYDAGRQGGFGGGIGSGLEDCEGSGFSGKEEEEELNSEEEEGGSHARSGCSLSG